jgi:hypothetical protein
MFKNQKKIIALFIFFIGFEGSLLSQESEINPPTFILLLAGNDNLLTQPLQANEIENWNKFMNDMDTFILKKGHTFQVQKTQEYSTFFSTLKEIASNLIGKLQENYANNIIPAINTEEEKKKGIKITEYMITKENTINENSKLVLQDIAKNLQAKDIQLLAIEQIVKELKKQKNEIETIKTKLKTELEAIAKSEAKKISSKEKTILNAEKNIVDNLEKLAEFILIPIEKIDKDFKRLQTVLPYLKAEGLIQEADPEKYKEPEWAKSPYEKEEKPKVSSDLKNVKESLKKLTEAFKGLSTSLGKA